MPGGMNTGFAKASNLENTSLAKAMTFSPEIVAQDGYKANACAVKRRYGSNFKTDAGAVGMV